VSDSSLCDKKILVTGANGFLGRHVVDVLRARGVSEANLRCPRSSEVDLLCPAACAEAVDRMDLVIHLAANIGGIAFNKEYPGELLYANSLMGLQLIEAARQQRVAKTVILGTTCSYPKQTPVPFREQELWNGPLDETTGPYGLSKLLLLRQAQTYRQQYGFNGIFLIPANVYGPGDHFDDARAHVVPALIKRFITAAETNAPEVVVWGTGQASREFLYVTDAARAIVLACEKYDGAEPMNLGTGEETPIRELAETIAEQTGYQGEIVWDATKPDGQPRRSLDVTRAREELGFVAETSLADGLAEAIAWYNQQRA